MINKKSGIWQWQKIGLMLVIIICIVAVLLLLPQWGVGPIGDNRIMAASVSGKIIDKNVGVADNFRNGKVVIEITVTQGDIDDVLASWGPLQISISEYQETRWEVPTINLRDNSGATEENYGENVECDGVIAGPIGSNDNLYIKISVPTMPGGDVLVGMTIKIEMWPTNDAVDAIDGIISPASFDDVTIYNWWDEGDNISLLIVGRSDTLGPVGSNVPSLVGIEIDE